MAVRVVHATTVTGAVDPTKQVNGPQWNEDHEVLGLGTAAEQDVDAFDPAGSAAAVAASFVDNETPGGIISGTNGSDGLAAFTLAHAPSPAGSLRLVKTDVGTGVEMLSGIHYNLVGNTITYTAGNIPVVGMAHRAWYRF